MENPIENYWKIRLNDLKKALEQNHFEVHLADDSSRARDMVLTELLPKIKPSSVSWGGSMTFRSTGLYEDFKSMPGVEILDTYDTSNTPEERLEIRRRSLLVDLFITGTNAVTETGILVNLDMLGNRVGGLTFGPKYVIVLVGRNKLVADLDEAMLRIKEYVAPVNAMRLDMKTPCVKTANCDDCSSLGRICNTWVITEKSFPKERIKIVLINQSLGL
ncbi:MAG: lactate utilization protein [Deltaproteobacteria bacterium HGW-Deltaproteobacteria-21]|nr:MAG: lactate utilization protein [Deltaproteobacteria bacterium HGW-Deltaproteobacteria-21]